MAIARERSCTVNDAEWESKGQAFLRVLPQSDHKAALDWELSDVTWKELLTGLNRDGGPGYPWRGATIGDVVDTHEEELRVAVRERISAYGKQLKEDVALSPQRAYELNLSDPVRVMVKGEPHGLNKAKEERWRIIQATSLVDQLVERWMSMSFHVWEVENWKTLPVMIGSGHSREDIALLAKRMKDGVGSDMSSFDWRQDSRFGPIYARAMAVMYQLTPEHEAVLALREELCKHKLLVHSDGTFAVDTDGSVLLTPHVHATGRYSTGHRNSWYRTFLHFVCMTAVLDAYPMNLGGSYAVGDDHIGRVPAKNREDYKKEVARWGFSLKCWNKEFCGYLYGESQAPTRESIAKALHKYSTASESDREVRRASLLEEYSLSPIFAPLLAETDKALHNQKMKEKLPPPPVLPPPVTGRAGGGAQLQ